jgi:hypothetical protein
VYVPSVPGFHQEQNQGPPSACASGTTRIIARLADAKVEPSSAGGARAKDNLLKILGTLPEFRQLVRATAGPLPRWNPSYVRQVLS